MGYGRAQTRQACANVVAALALTMVEVRALIDERMVVEIDATAFVG